MIGIAKAVEELAELGWITGKRPRLVAAQARGCAPVVRAFDRGDERCDTWEDPSTVAFGIAVPRPFGDRLILAALRGSAGTAVAVDDDSALEELNRAARVEGLFLCPEGAVCV